MSNVVYEHPEYPLDEKAAFLRLNSHDRPVWMTHTEMGFDSAIEGFAPQFYRRYMRRKLFAPHHPYCYPVIRLSDPAYYVPENPHTDSGGLLTGARLGWPSWLSPEQCVRVFYRRSDGSEYFREQLAGDVDWQRVNAMRVLESPQDAEMLDTLADVLVKDILGLMGEFTEDIFGIAPDPKPELRRTNKFRQQRRMVSLGAPGWPALKDLFLQQYWESEDGEYGEWRDVPIVGGSFSDV